MRLEITGAFVTAAIRAAYERSDLHQLAELVPDMRVVDVVRIGRGVAVIVGTTEDGFEVVDATKVVRGSTYAGKPIEEVTLHLKREA